MLSYAQVRETALLADCRLASGQMLRYDPYGGGSLWLTDGDGSPGEGWRPFTGTPPEEGWRHVDRPCRCRYCQAHIG